MPSVLYTKSVPVSWANLIQIAKLSRKRQVLAGRTKYKEEDVKKCEGKGSWYPTCGAGSTVLLCGKLIWKREGKGESRLSEPLGGPGRGTGARGRKVKRAEGVRRVGDTNKLEHA